MSIHPESSKQLYINSQLNIYSKKTAQAISPKNFYTELNPYGGSEIRQNIEMEQINTDYGRPYRLQTAT